LRFAEHVRPAFARDLQKAQRELPKCVELVRHQLVEALPRHVARCHVVHEPGEVVRQSGSGCRRLRHERRSGRAVDFRRLRPRHHQPGQQELAFKVAQRPRQCHRIRGDAAGSALGEGDLVFIDVADSDDAGQDRPVAAKPVKKGLAHQPAGATRRQIERRRGERQRIVGKIEAELAVVQCLDQRRQKRRRRRNVENPLNHVGIAEIAATV